MDFSTYMLLNLSISTWCGTLAHSWTPTISPSSEPFHIGMFPLSESILNHEYTNGDSLHRRLPQWNKVSRPMSRRLSIQGIH